MTWAGSRGVLTRRPQKMKKNSGKHFLLLCVWLFAMSLNAMANEMPHRAEDVPPLMPALPVLSNPTPYTLDLTLVPETPVANPPGTTYSIYCSTAGLFVQANGSLGATEVFRSMADWGTITVTGLTQNSNYCFYAKARSTDGEIAVASAGTFLGVETFTTSANFATTGNPTNVFFSPASCTTGGLTYSASTGCTGGGIGKTGSWTNFFGCYLRTPSVNCTGSSTVVVSFTVSNSYFAANPNDRLRFSMFADGVYKTGACISVKVNGVEASLTDINGRYLPFNVARTCASVEATFSLATTSNLSNVLFYIEPSNGYNNSNVFSVTLDNVSVSGGPLEACMSTAPLLLEGDYTVGTGGDYPSLTNAGGLFEAVNSATLVGNVTASIISNLTAETGLHPLNAWAEQGVGSYTLTIRPDGNVTRTIEGTYTGSSDANAGIYRLNGANRAIFDGRDPNNLAAGGYHLLFRNNHVLASNNFNSTFSFVNDACNDTLRYCIIEGGSTGANNGIVRFGLAGSGAGNDRIAIDHCRIRDRSNAVSAVYNGIYALGTFNKDNDNISITHNEIVNMWGVAANTNGILVSTYNSFWTIRGNSIYQTATRTSTGASVHTGIQILNTSSGDGFVLDGNYIGGTAPLAAGTPWVQNGAANSRFVGISVSGSTSGSSTIENNTITNMDWRCGSNSTSAAPGIFCGIYLVNGGFTVRGNCIGSATATGAITVTSTTTGPSTLGIAHTGSSGVLLISGNTVGGITVSGSTTSISHSLVGIQYGTAASGSVRSISNNLLGSRSTENSLHAATASTANSVQRVVGIDMLSGTNAATISGNTIAHLTNAYAGTNAGSQTTGINSPFGINGIVADTIHHISSAAALTGTGSNASVIGIDLSATAANGHDVSQNYVYALRSTAASAATSVVGIYYGGGNGTNRVARNTVFGLVSVSGGTSVLTGIYMGAGPVTVSNNKIRLGIDTEGASVLSPHTFTGILKDNISTNNWVYHNSVYIGGNGVLTTVNPTYAFRRLQTNANDNVRNNIFYNARSNATSGGKHYAVWLNNATTLVMDYNLLLADGTNGMLAGIGGVDYADLETWQTSTVFEANGISASPGFVDALSAIPDLNLNPSVQTLAESAGIVVAGLVDDQEEVDVRNGYPLAGQINGGGTAPDIGADENDFMHGIAGPLPVSLLNFEARCDGSAVKLLWATASEVNNERFTIHRSADLMVWEEVLTVTGAGNSNAELVYQAYDERPLNGQAYYRLTQTDFDGTTETFAPVGVDCEAVGTNGLFVYPNPASEQFTVAVTVDEDYTGAILEIVDINGKRMLSKTVSLTAGSSEWTFTRETLPGGTYTVLLKAGGAVVKPAKLVLR